MTVDPNACDGATCAEAPAVVIHHRSYAGEHQMNDGPCRCQPVVFCSGCGGRKPSTTPTRNSTTWWVID